MEKEFLIASLISFAIGMTILYLIIKSAVKASTNSDEVLSTQKRMVKLLEGLYVQGGGNLQELFKEELEIAKLYGIDSKTEPAFDKNNIEELHQLITDEKKKTFGSKKDDILNLLGRISSKEEAIDIIESYNSSQGANLLEELKSLSTSYATIKDYMESFISFDIVAAEYPHEEVVVV